MENNEELNPNQSFDIWTKIEKIIKPKESLILLILIIASFVYIPFKILSLGWTPPDDANRHVAFATLDPNTKWSDILVMDERFDSDHNAGWHSILRFLYKYCSFDKQDLMFFSVTALFLLVHICGIICAPSPISWCIAVLIILGFDKEPLRFLLGRPYLASYAVLLIMLRLWSIESFPKSNLKILNNIWFKYSITIIALTLGVWIHGSWYLYLLIPFSFFLAGKNKDALKLTLCIFVSTIIGSLLTEDFWGFLKFHYLIAFTIFSEKTYNWLLAKEFACGIQPVYWILPVGLLLFLRIKKCNYKINYLANDSIFVFTLLCWLCSIYVIRFWIDWGRISLILWVSILVGNLISTFDSLKIPRIKYSLALFILTSLIACYTNDCNGRYTKPVLKQPIDFYNASTKDLLKDWKPLDGGIIYSIEMNCFYLHFFQYPNTNWKYVTGFEPAIMKSEDKLTLRNIYYSNLEEDFTPWINKMTKKDRLILDHELASFPQLEWIRANRHWWIGRLKQ